MLPTFPRRIVFIVDNSGSQTNLYPFMVDNSNAGIEIYGATINGNVSLTGEWLDLYVNSAAFMVRDTEQARISDIRITQAWDALRVAGDSDGFEISNVWVSDVRDDAFENDNPVSGAIRNSLFDGVFSGISLGHKNMADASHEVLELDGVLMRMESYLFKGQMTHQSPFKMESKSPQLSITDSVIAIDNVNHVGDSRLKMAWDKTIHSSNNVFLNLSNDPLPSDYPMPPAGWTVLQGQQARDYWDAAREDWIATRGDDAGPEDGGSQEPVIRPDDDNDAADGSEALTLEGTSGDDQLTGSAGDDALLGKQGSDELLGGGGSDELRGGSGSDKLFGGSGKDDMYGGAGGDELRGGSGNDDLRGRKGNDALSGGTGEDVLTGGAGKDVFIFNTAPDGSTNVDTITDFKPGTDKIALDTSVFTSLKGGGDTLDAAFFEIAARADDSNDHIMYKWKTGELFYDADGSGSGKQIKIAQFDKRLDLDHTDFVVIGEQEPAVDSDGNWNGEDIITFEALPADGSFQEISGFAPGSDKFVFDSSAFTALQDQQGGMLDETHFEIAARADDIDDYVMYKWKTGELFYDADGRGGSDQIKIAQLDAQMALDHSDFLVL